MSEKQYMLTDFDNEVEMLEKIDEQQDTISQLKEENEQLRKELEKVKLLNESLGLFMNE